MRFHSKEIDRITPGFYADRDGGQYFCLSDFFAAYSLPATLEFVVFVLDEVMREFPRITVIEFADRPHSDCRRPH